MQKKIELGVCNFIQQMKWKDYFCAFILMSKPIFPWVLCTQCHGRGTK